MINFKVLILGLSLALSVSLADDVVEETKEEEPLGIPRHFSECIPASRVCQNFHVDNIKKVNFQIQQELSASYTYQAMANYFGRADVGLRGFNKFFQKMSDEEREHALKFMQYMNKRGGKIEHMNITKPHKEEWKSGLAAIVDSINLERRINEHLLDLHWLAQSKNDAHLQDFLDGDFLKEQVDSIDQLVRYLSILQKVKDTPLGEVMFDQDLYEEKR